MSDESEEVPCVIRRGSADMNSDEEIFVKAPDAETAKNLFDYANKKKNE